jgi:two-component sensor histidine kinase
MSEEAAKSRILYVEDDEGLARLAERALTRRDFVVVPATTVSGGLALFRSQDFDAVVLDHYLPDGIGMDFLRDVGSCAEHVPIVYVTASDEARVAIEALTGGAADYVVKSVDDQFFPLLIAALDTAIRTSRLKKDKERTDKLLVAAKERAELMLAEMNHRIANSLSLVSAMIRMQIQAVSGEETKEALAETQSRISAVAELHRSLYTSDDVAEVDLRNYLGSLIASIESGAHRTHDPVTITHAVGNISVSADKAVALGVILTELLTNALKYAYPASSGEVRVELWEDGGDVVLATEDRGVGYDPTAKARGSGLGTKLIKAMTTNLAATLTHSMPSGGGTLVEIRWSR